MACLHLPVNVGVIQLGQETDFRGAHRVLGREKQLKTEESTLIRRIDWTSNRDVEIANVILIGGRVNSFDRFSE